MYHLPCDGECGLLAESHAAIDAQDTLVPACNHVMSTTLYSREMQRFGHTADDLADSNLGLEIATSNGRVEPAP